eukprot:CAMPEP_0184375846 /NCGR_PEP_ID=MMETSP0007-20130409/945_1 /TAXON_ID=97485 /ORGANISM="Prymnesium parvum, Strain Texoma1" /LENGTH=146 /DNA_ID=CAMNT_0026719177 /DNA_START=312 /DNA_END=751 /DNA_ORIENTATION=-
MAMRGSRAPLPPYAAVKALEGPRSTSCTPPPTPRRAPACPARAPAWGRGAGSNARSSTARSTRGSPWAGRRAPRACVRLGSPDISSQRRRRPQRIPLESPGSSTHRRSSRCAVSRTSPPVGGGGGEEADEEHKRSPHAELWTPVSN